MISCKILLLAVDEGYALLNEIIVNGVTLTKMKKYVLPCVCRYLCMCVLLND